LEHHSDVRERIQELLRTGRLLTRRPLRIWAGSGAGEPWSICDAPVGFGDVLYEWLDDDGRRIRLHAPCYAAFVAEIDSRGDA